MPTPSKRTNSVKTVNQTDSKFTTYLNTTLLWLKQNTIYFILVFLFSAITIISMIVVQKYLIEKPESLPSSNKNMQVDLDRLLKLETEIEKLNNNIKKLEAENTNLGNTNKIIERRLQSHTDTFKRLCEYVMVITVDKKIIPRQCLPEYKWGKEEGTQ